MRELSVVIENMRRVSHREVEDPGSRSRWQMDVRVSRRGGVSRVEYAVTSHRRDPSESREDRYFPSTGTTAAVKRLMDMTGTVRGLPTMVLKSFHRNVWRHPRLRIVDIDRLRRAALYLQAQGLSCFVGEHEDRTLVVDGVVVRKKPFMVMECINNGNDLYRSVQTENIKLDTPEAVNAFAKALIKLMALLQFYHEQERRPFLDLKSENIMPILTAEGIVSCFILVDWDAAFGNIKMYTAASVTVADYQRIHGSHIKVSDLTNDIDFHTLANELVFCVDCLAKGSIFNVKWHSSVSEKGGHQGLSETLLAGVEERYMPLVALYNQLKHAVPGCNARRLVEEAFRRHPDGEDYLQCYQEAYDLTTVQYVEAQMREACRVERLSETKRSSPTADTVVRVSGLWPGPAMPADTGQDKGGYYSLMIEKDEAEPRGDDSCCARLLSCFKR